MSSKPPKPPKPPRHLPRLDILDDEITQTRQTETNQRAPSSVRETLRDVITILVGFDAGRVCALTEKETWIGRSADCGLMLPDPDISRKHACLVRQGTTIVVRDNGSKNGTFVDGERVCERILRANDEIQLGAAVTLLFSRISETEEALAQQLYQSSMRDALTGAYNRRYFIRRLREELLYAQRHQGLVSLIVFDLDHFKSLNDMHGHSFGDLVLRSAVSSAIATLRTEDVFARIGGEEFAIILRGIGPAGARTCAERIRLAISTNAVRLGESAATPTVSAGIATLSECAKPGTVEQLLEIADARLYQAKRNGRNCVEGV
jgi:diguanylate cyclase (GGDEF)-like protein